jgi:hypothetical protein
MKSRAAVVIVTGVLLLSGSGSTLAAGKMGGITGGIDVVGRDQPVYAGKLGGSTGVDEFLLADAAEAQSRADAGATTRPVALGGKLGGGMDDPVTLDGNLGIATGDS